MEWQLDQLISRDIERLMLFLKDRHKQELHFKNFISVLVKTEKHVEFYTNPEFLSFFKTTREKIFPHLSARIPSIGNEKSVTPVIKTIFLPFSQSPILELVVYESESQASIISYISLDSYLKIFNRTEGFLNMMIDFSGTILLSNKTSLSNEMWQNQSTLEEIKKIIHGDLNNGTQNIKDQYLLAFKKMKQVPLLLISALSQEKAFQTANFLVKKSLYFGIFTLCLAIIIGILFSRPLTSHVRKLFEGIQKMAQGEFKTEVSVKSSDEIGVLSDSFNYMSSEIVRYMEEMKEKSRLENELKVANLVQNSFFPEENIQLKQIKISAFYRPATECGGDFWTYLSLPDKTIILIADATGHGVPAALLTATINCCAINLEKLIELDPVYAQSPAKILEFMNQAVCQSNDQILLTAFVGIIDHLNNQLFYSNASHPPIFLYQHVDGKEVDKSSFKSVAGAKSPRLGHQENSNFAEESLPFLPKDKLIFYTDGLLEGQNTKGDVWGKRRFLKSLIATAQEDAEQMKKSIIDSAYEFYEGIPQEDDITLVIAEQV